MSNETLFFVLGPLLAVSAVVVAFVGLRVKGFPGKAAPLVFLWFAILVGATTTFAVLHSKDEESAKEKSVNLPQATRESEEAENQ
jgi:type III secretory pathway component EscV